MQSLVSFLILLPILAGCMAGPRTQYEVETFTGNKFGAGTDARVFITLFGDRGRSKEIELESKGRNDFEKGQKDKFFIQTKNLGKISAINIRHDNSWFGSGWYLEKVRIKSKDGCVYDFPNHKWLASSVGDGKISREIFGRDHCRNMDSPPPGCQGSLGVSAGLIKDSQITASSSYDEHHQPYHARLNKTVKGSRGGWCSAFADETEFLEVNLVNKTTISGISTQGQSMFDNWVTKYLLSYSLNGKHWRMVPDKQMNDGSPRNFTGNKDRDTVVTHWFPEITARHLRVLPLKWSGLTNCMRIELYGCKNGTDDAHRDAAREGKQENQAKNSKPQGESNDQDENKIKDTSK